MALERLFDLTGNTAAPDALYIKIVFPDPSEESPYLYINMVATVDGKIVLGKIGGTAAGVGGSTDQKLFRRLQHHCDAVLLGSSTLRASPVIYPPQVLRFVVTRTGEIPLENRFFTDAPDLAYVLVPEDLPAAVLAKLTASTNVIQIGKGEVDLKAALRMLRQERNIRHLLCEGGANLNAELLQAGLADELFLTIAPKIKGGAALPTIVEGTGFPPSEALPLTLLSLYRDEDELYLRYRIGRELRTYTRAKPD